MKHIYGQNLVLAILGTLFMFGCNIETNVKKVQKCEDNAERCNIINNENVKEICDGGLWIQNDICEFSCIIENSKVVCGECKDGSIQCGDDNKKYNVCVNGKWTDGGVCDTFCLARNNIVCASCSIGENICVKKTISDNEFEYLHYSCSKDGEFIDNGTSKDIPCETNEIKINSCQVIDGVAWKIDGDGKYKKCNTNSCTENDCGCNNKPAVCENDENENGTLKSCINGSWGPETLCHNIHGLPVSCKNDEECGEECLNLAERCFERENQVCRNGKWEKNSDCPSGCDENGKCKDNTLEPEPECGDGKPCAEGKECNAEGKCVDKAADPECGDGKPCAEGKECNAEGKCVDKTAEPECGDSKPCDNGKECILNQCQDKCDNSLCEEGKVCVNNECVSECIEDDDDICKTENIKMHCVASQWYEEECGENERCIMNGNIAKCVKNNDSCENNDYYCENNSIYKCDSKSGIGVYKCEYDDKGASVLYSCSGQNLNKSVVQCDVNGNIVNCSSDPQNSNPIIQTNVSYACVNGNAYYCDNTEVHHNNEFNKYGCTKDKDDSDVVFRCSDDNNSSNPLLKETICEGSTIYGCVNSELKALNVVDSSFFCVAQDGKPGEYLNCNNGSCDNVCVTDNVGESYSLKCDAQDRCKIIYCPKNTKCDSGQCICDSDFTRCDGEKSLITCEKDQRYQFDDCKAENTAGYCDPSTNVCSYPIA